MVFRALRIGANGKINDTLLILSNDQSAAATIRKHTKSIRDYPPGQIVQQHKPISIRRQVFPCLQLRLHRNDLRHE
jgi:hypothetical protein